MNSLTLLVNVGILLSLRSVWAKLVEWLGRTIVNVSVSWGISNMAAMLDRKAQLNWRMFSLVYSGQLCAHFYMTENVVFWGMRQNDLKYFEDFSLKSSFKKGS